MICRGCGGVVGRDCFNPAECEWIAQDMQRAHWEALEREHYEALERASLPVEAPVDPA